MIYGSVCSGIEAASVAWHPLGWKPAFFSEIEAFPRTVLAARWPGVPVHGDFTTIAEDSYAAVDLVVGGTPCQDFSVAGLRAGLAGVRGDLTLAFLQLVGRLRPRWVVWENVPGVLSIDGGRAFGAFLGGLGELGYGFAYRVLDAQHFGVPQRRRRVFVVGHLGDWRRAAAVLFERESPHGHPPPRREAGEGLASTIASRPTGGGGLGTDFDCDGGLIANTVDTAPGTRQRCDASDNLIVHSLRAGGHDRSHANAGVMPAVAFQFKASAQQSMNPSGIAPGLQVGKSDGTAVQSDMSVRRLTPRECERLQGFEDDYTLIEYNGRPAADGPRYKALGNSMAVPVMRWIGERIELVEGIAAGRI